VAVLIGNGIKAFLAGARFDTPDQTLRCHELEVSIHGPETDPRQPLPYPQIHLIGAGVVPAEAEFLQNHGPLLRFSQNIVPVVIIITITILKLFSGFVKAGMDNFLENGCFAAQFSLIFRWRYL
jgi:hypothetical protein